MEQAESGSDSDGDEAGLVRQARDGDPAAFGRLVERYKDAVYAAILAVTRDFDAAHDVAQEVFLRAWFGLGRLEETAAFGPWMRAIARNRARTWLERRQHRPPTEAIEVDEIADRAASPEEEAERAERRRIVRSALDRLPETSREVLVLHYLEGLATPRIAASLGITEAAVRQRLRRARLHMQEEIEEMVADAIRDEAPGPQFTRGVEAMLERTKELFHQVRYRAAVPVLESARERAPDDTLVSLLLADAYTFTRTPEELAEDRGAYDRALALLDEVVAREPENTLARLRRAALRWTLGSLDEAMVEQQRILEDARGGPYESVAQLELARRYMARGQGAQALALYREMEPQHPWLACVLHSELGVAHALTGDGAAAVARLRQAVEATTPAAMAALQERSRQLLGPSYWAFWSTVDSLPVRQCQNHAWLAGLTARSGDLATARTHLAAAVAYLRDPEMGPAREVLRKEFVSRMEQMFPELAGEPEVEQLRREIAAGPG